MNYSDFNIREYDDRDFDVFMTWWRKWRWGDRVSKEILPDIGYVIEKNNIALCGGFLYTTNSLLASIEWVVSNPFADKRDTDKALDYLIECLYMKALKEGKKIVMTTIKNDAFAMRLKMLGFSQTDKGLTQYIRTGLWR